MTEPDQSGTLYIVATPIGNRADISARAIEILKAVDAIIAEDTRHSRPLLQLLGIDKPLIALHEHNERHKAAQLINDLVKGKTLALISDAGTPLISDPGYRLVSIAHACNITVSPIPGPSALTAALSVCGLPTDQFLFVGFLASSNQARRKRLAELAAYPYTIVLFEAPHRVIACLEDLSALFGRERQACVCKELSKRFESVHRATLSEQCAWIKAQPLRAKGEFVLAVKGCDTTIEAPLNPIWLQHFETLAAYMPPKKAAALIADLTGANKQQLYQAGVEMRQK